VTLGCKEKAMALIKDELMGGVRIVVFDTDKLLDGAEIDQCYREIIQVLNKTQEHNLLLHFGRVKFMSSAALSVLIRILKKCKEFKISLKLCNISPEEYEVFKITGMNKLFEIYDDAAQAMDAFKQGYAR
jgi:anti-sigma B factor antagonist